MTKLDSSYFTGNTEIRQPTYDTINVEPTLRTDIPLDPIIKEAITTMRNASCTFGYIDVAEQITCPCPRCKTLTKLLELYI